MSKIIYTSIFGNYDTLKEPQVITPGWKYVCYTDQDFISDVWQIIKVQSVDPWKSSKIYKILYEPDGKSIYIDGTFIINCNLDNFFDLYYDGKIALMKHPERDCVYQEIEACIKLKRDDERSLLSAKNKLIGLGIKEKSGLAASGIILRYGNAKSFTDVWFKYIDICRRDQVSWAAANYLRPGECKLFNYHYGNETSFLHVPHNTQPEKRIAKLRYYKSKNLIK